MTSVAISLGDEAREFLDRRAQARGYSDLSWAIEELVEEAMERQADPELEAFLLEGVQSGGEHELTPEFWQGVEEEALSLVAAKKA
ncbi:MAG TPA: ribbon-helix-helix protein, CopG family [Armatimonadota bacterium]|jgi:hypothetical protein